MLILLLDFLGVLCQVLDYFTQAKVMFQRIRICAAMSAIHTMLLVLVDGSQNESSKFWQRQPNIDVWAIRSSISADIDIDKSGNC